MHRRLSVAVTGGQVLRFVLAIVALVATLAPTANAAQSPDATGRWDVTIASTQGPLNAVMVLKKDGDKLTGTLNAVQGEGTGEGTQKDSAIALTFSGTTQQGEKRSVTLKGVQDGDVMKGTMEMGRDPLEWTAKRSTAAAAANLTGTWTFEVQSDAGTGTPTMVFKQVGEKLSGSYSGLLGEAPLTGTVTGKNITFQITANVQGTSLTVVYSGTVETDAAVKGTVKLGDLGEGTFTAKKK
jgi:hypothetical protein